MSSHTNSVIIPVHFRTSFLNQLRFYLFGNLPAPGINKPVNQTFSASLPCYFILFFFIFAHLTRLWGLQETPIYASCNKSSVLNGRQDTVFLGAAYRNSREKDHHP
jgi:hypothetical protein